MSIVSRSVQPYSGFDPQSIPGCQMWFDAADSRTLTLSGNSVTQWADKSKNQIIAAPSNPSFIPFLTSDGGVNFNDTNTGFRLSSNAYEFSSSAGSLSFFMVYYTTLSSNDTALRINRVGGGQSRFTIANLNINARRNDGDVTAVLNTTIRPIGAMTVYHAIVNYSERSAAIYVNGALSASSSSFLTQGDTPSTVTTDVTLGNTPLNDRPFRGRIYEALCYNLGITDVQRQQVEGYLAWKWGIQTSLPTNHIFRYNSVFTRPFYPSDLTGLELWLDASDMSTITGTSNVTQWLDKSGNRRHATSTNGPSTISYAANSPTHLFFNGVNQHFENTTTVPLNSHTLIALHRPETSQQNTSLFRFQNGTFIVFPFMNGATPRGYITSQNSVIGAATSTLLENSSTTDFNISVAAISTGYQRIFNNGILQSSNSAVLSSTAASSLLRIGSYNGNAEFYKGDLAEMLIFNRRLTGSEIQKIEGYLFLKWRAYLSIPTPPHAIYLPESSVTFSLFTPTSLSGLSLWLDASDMSTITGTSNVTQWNDKSGNARHATSLNGPSASTYNSYPVLSFNGLNQHFENTTTIPLNAHTLIALHRPETSQQNTSLFRFQNGNFIVFPFMNGATPRGYITNQNTAISAGTSTLLENSSTTNFNVIVAAISSGDQKISNNGILQASNSALLGSSSASPLLRIGSYNGNAEFYKGDLAEMLIFNRRLTGSEIQTIEGYLTWKWGFSTVLPTTHAYKNFRA